MDDLRSQIWDLLYRCGEPQSISSIAEQLNESAATVQEAVDDPWFDVQDDSVAIAVRDQ